MYINRKYKNETLSRCKPRGRRACLCNDNTYSRKCCDGTLRGQGIGEISFTASTDNFILLESGSFVLLESGSKIKLEN